jgi:hypothetical protein
MTDTDECIFTSSGRFFGGNLVQNNGEVGLQLVGGSSAEFFVLTLQDGTIGQTIVQGHSGTGVNVVQSSAAAFNGPNVIRHNGSASDSLRSGIRIEHSNVTLDGTTIAGNTGPGIVASESSCKPAVRCCGSEQLGRWCTSKVPVEQRRFLASHDFCERGIIRFL